MDLEGQGGAHPVYDFCAKVSHHKRVKSLKDGESDDHWEGCHHVPIGVARQCTRMLEVSMYLGYYSRYTMYPA